MKIPAFVPSDLRQLLRFVPTSGWDAIAWSPLLSSMREISTRYVTGRGTSKLRGIVGDAVPDIYMVPKLRGVTRLDGIDDAASLQAAGDHVLRLYFAQWLLDEGLFIDMRSVRFGLDDDGDLHFAPNGLWIRLRPEFREGTTEGAESGRYSWKP